MKCKNCGANIPEQQLICPGCGQQIQIVPDYNPLDDVLTAQVKGAVSRTMTMNTEAVNNSRKVGMNTSGRENIRRNENGRGNQSSGTTGRILHQERQKRRRQLERKRRIAKKKRQRALIITAISLVLCVIIGVVCYQNSYTGQVKKGYHLLSTKEYDKAVIHFEKAISKNEKKPEAYTGLAEVYIQQDDMEAAEQVFQSAISQQSTNAELYEATIQFYLDTKQESKISELLDECSDDRVLKELSAYISQVPEFSLDENDTYDDITALELTSKEDTIYYTTDKTDPTVSSTKYTEPIKLEEGETEVRAISVNEKGIPSLVVSKTYTVEFPLADAPSVTPSTGQYEEAQTIEVVIPENYEAYYTTDGSDPDPDSSTTKKYTGPVEMMEGNTIFSVVLVDKKGRISDITKRNYELILAE